MIEAGTHDASEVGYRLTWCIALCARIMKTELYRPVRSLSHTINGKTYASVISLR